VARFSGVFLEDPDQHPRIQRRIELTAAEIERAGAPALRVPARGETRLERVLSLVMLGDLVSVGLAELNGADPDEIEALVRLKDSLAQP
jgi:glucose/mannose-6-phosphate isomerase